MVSGYRLDLHPKIGASEMRGERGALLGGAISAGRNPDIPEVSPDAV